MGDPQSTNIWTYQKKGGSPQSKCLPEVSGGQISHRLSPLSQHSSCDLRLGLQPASHAWFSFQLPGQTRSQVFSHYTIILPRGPECLSGVGCVGLLGPACWSPHMHTTYTHSIHTCTHAHSFLASRILMQSLLSTHSKPEMGAGPEPQPW